MVDSIPVRVKVGSHNFNYNNSPFNEDYELNERDNLIWLQINQILDKIFFHKSTEGTIKDNENKILITFKKVKNDLNVLLPEHDFGKMFELLFKSIQNISKKNPIILDAYELRKDQNRYQQLIIYLSKLPLDNNIILSDELKSDLDIFRKSQSDKVEKKVEQKKSNNSEKTNEVKETYFNVLSKNLNKKVNEAKNETVIINSNSNNKDKQENAVNKNHENSNNENSSDENKIKKDKGKKQIKREQKENLNKEIRAAKREKEAFKARESKESTNNNKSKNVIDDIKIERSKKNKMLAEEYRKKNKSQQKKQKKLAEKKELKAEKNPIENNNNKNNSDTNNKQKERVEQLKEDSRRLIDELSENTNEVLVGNSSTNEKQSNGLIILVHSTESQQLTGKNKWYHNHDGCLIESTFFARNSPINLATVYLALQNINQNKFSSSTKKKDL